MKILIADSAFEDLQTLQNYYQEKHLAHIGEKYVTNIIQKLEILSDFPDIGRIVPEFNVVKIRELIYPPFRIIYLREQSSIHVIRVWRSERILKLPVR